MVLLSGSTWPTSKLFSGKIDVYKNIYKITCSKVFSSWSENLGKLRVPQKIIQKSIKEVCHNVSGYKFNAL